SDRGKLAFFWTIHVPEYGPPFNEIRESYRRLAPHLDDSRNRSLEQSIQDTSAVIVKGGWFTWLEVKRYNRVEDYTADGYIALLNTNSRHRLLPEDVRAELFHDIRAAIERHGGVLRKRQAVLLFLARKKTQPDNGAR
ncbi:MAG: hypothetical protein K0Q59_5060, partial [Paenibacillus sp.]|nr:hypothetical protein [Paenibacillus sp.]